MPVYLWKCPKCGRRFESAHYKGEGCSIDHEFEWAIRDYKGEAAGVAISGRADEAKDVDPRDFLPTMDDMRRSAAQEGGYKTSVEGRAEKKMQDWKNHHEPHPDNKQPLDPTKL